MSRQIADMVVLITGASSGIGRALAEALGRRGAKLVLAARRHERLCALNRSLGGNHLCLQADVSRSEDCERIVQAAYDQFGRIDTLVCNAGYGFARPFDAMSTQDVRKIFDTNLFGTTECIRIAAPLMRRQEIRDGYRGQVMIVSSACARRGLPFFSTYAATKAAQLSLAEGLRIEFKPLGIAVTSIHPVLTATDFFSTAHDLSGMNPQALAQGSMQPASVVAAKMVKAIERPRGEMWPKPFSRLSLTMAVLLPGITDAVLSKIRNKMISNHMVAEPSHEIESQAEPAETAVPQSTSY